MTTRRAVAWLTLALAVAACSGPSSPYAGGSPAFSSSPTARAAPATVSSSSVESPDQTPSASPTTQPTSLPVPPPSLVCTGQYQSGHPLVTAMLFSQAGYGSLAVLDVADPLAPSAVCTINNSPYSIQRVQWLSATEFLLISTASQPSQILAVDVQRRTVSTLRTAGGLGLAALSPDRNWLATMEAGDGGTTVARLYGPAGVRTMATL